METPCSSGTSRHSDFTAKIGQVLPRPNYRGVWIRATDPALGSSTSAGHTTAGGVAGRGSSRRTLLISLSIVAGCWVFTPALFLAMQRIVLRIQTPVHIAMIALAGAAVAVADVLIKRSAAQTQSFSGVVVNPLMALAIGLYLLQIALFAYVFAKRWDLSFVGLAQMIVYAATVVIIGIIVFQEKLTVTHGVGVAIALLGAILMSL